MALRIINYCILIPHELIIERSVDFETIVPCSSFVNSPSSFTLDSFFVGINSKAYPYPSFSHLFDANYSHPSLNHFFEEEDSPPPTSPTFMKF